MPDHAELTRAFHDQQKHMQVYKGECTSVIRNWFAALCRELHVEPDQVINLPQRRLPVIYYVQTGEQSAKRTAQDAVRMDQDGTCHLTVMVTLGREGSPFITNYAIPTRVKISGGPGTGRVATIQCYKYEKTFEWFSDTQQMPDLDDLAKEVTAVRLDTFKNGFQRILNGDENEPDDPVAEEHWN